MSRIAFLGLGAMGCRMATNLVRAGHDVVVYNRSPEAANALLSLGASSATTPAEAAEGAEFVISMVTDDQAARAVWLAPEAGALWTAKPGTTLIESSTVAPLWVEELAAAAAAENCQLLDAPVAGTLPQAEAAGLVFLVGGPKAALDRAQCVFDVLGSSTYWVGRQGHGCRMKLVVNALFAGQVALLAELLGFLQRSGIEPSAAMGVLSELPVMSPAAKLTGGLMAAGNHPSLFPVRLVAKDLRYASEAVGSQGEVVDAVRRAFEVCDEQGLSDRNLTSIATLHLSS